MKYLMMALLVLLSTSAEAKPRQKSYRSSYRVRSYSQKSYIRRVSLPAPRLMPVQTGLTDVETDSRQIAQASSGNRGWELGFELGAIGRSNNSSGGFLGLDILPGIRVVSRHRWKKNWYLRPSVGYFRGSQGEAASSVTQNILELGLSIDYVLSRSSRTVVTVGLANRVEAIFSSITVLNSSGGTAIGTFYRLGPAFGVHSWLSPNTALVFNVEAGVTLASPMRKYVGATMGFMFRMK